MLRSVSTDAPVTALAVVVMGRVTLGRPMFIIAATTLVYKIMLLMVLYFGLRHPGVVIHQPTSLAAMWATLYASNAKEECAVVHGRENPCARATASLDRREVWVWNLRGR